MTTGSRTALEAAEPRLAVLFRDHGSSIDTTVEVSNADEQADVLYDLLADKGIVGEPVEIHVVPGPVAVLNAVAVKFVERTMQELVDGERGLDEVNELLRPLSPALLEDSEAEAIRRADRNAFLDGCVRTARIEELADLMDRAAKTGGLPDVGDRDLDAEDRQREWLVRVLAGQEDHSGADAPCHRCATVVHSTASDLDTTTETSEEAA